MSDILDTRARDAGVRPSRTSKGAGVRPVGRAKPEVVRGGHTDLLKASQAVGDVLPIKTAVASVSDKTGLTALAQGLAKFGVQVIATEGTADHLGHEAAGLKTIGLSKYTDFPENLNGRLKTLHPKIQAGVLGIKKFHDRVLKKIDARFIDLVIVNLYPFEKTVRSGADFFECIENIDIGGPALLRAGAKNHACVCVVSDPQDYPSLLDEMSRHKGGTSLAFRRQCAQKVFERTSEYDHIIAAWFRSYAK
jgi:phosphoribosylaminoimidazolecarboxamide formyltransferase / IMP cyclohydrolase